MTRLGGIFWFILVIASGMTNFLVKQSVQNLDDQLAHVRHKTLDEQKKIHDLIADWTYLNQPELLADLNNRYVHLVAISPKQVVTSLDTIPLRPAPPVAPEPAPAPQIAEIAPPPAPAPPVPPPPAPTPPTLPPPTTTAAPTPPAMPARAPIVPVAATATARPAIVQTAAVVAPVRAPQPPPPAASRSLDGVFAQVTGDR